MGKQIIEQLELKDLEKVFREIVRYEYGTIDRNADFVWNRFLQELRKHCSVVERIG